MKRYILFFLLSFFISPAGSQTIITRDPEIEKMVGEISREDIEACVRKLVSFHTRHIMSEQDNPVRGIGAAWNWIKGEMEKSIPVSGGRLSVQFEEYSVGGEGQRIPKETPLKNVVAKLKGIDPADDRIIVVSAHLDSRAAADNDFTSFAPGANDDGSGIAALLEMVRIMSKRKFPATIVFMAVSGEEHGLYGARHMAAKAKEENWNIIAMLNNDMIGNSGSSETLLNDNMRVRVFSLLIPAGMRAFRCFPAVRQGRQADDNVRIHQEHTASISATVLGIGLPSNLLPFPVMTILSSILTPPKSLNLSASS